MKRLWAPWRLQYMTAPRQAECIFCAAAASGDDRASLVVHRGGRVFVILNRFPYTTGHLMVVPVRHVRALTDLDDAEALEMVRLVDLSLAAQQEVYHPEGTNIGLNMGRAAGAGIDDHLHIHVVPRWVGDTNFMPVLGDVKVIPEHLETTFDRLREAFGRLAGSPGPARR